MVGEIGRGSGVPSWRAALAAILAAAVLIAMATSAAVAAKGSADVQWAQQALKERGFDPGKPSGEINAKTKAALSAFQHTVGLPVSGVLDQPTIDRLMTGRAAPGAVGNLAAPKHGTGGAADHPAHPAAAPHAAPSGRIEAVGAVGGIAALSAIGGDAGAMASAPRAVPSGTVDTMVTAPPAGQRLGAEADGGSLTLEAPDWVRTLVIAVILGILGGFVGLWWWSGRGHAHFRGPPLSETSHRERLEPRFGIEASVGPRLETGLRARR